MKRLLAILLLLPSLAWAQPFVMPPPGGITVTAPYGKTSTVTKVTISVTNTYQTALAANSLRLGCLIQNTGASTMYVYIGAVAPADNTTSFNLAAGDAISCATMTGGVITDAILITGTSTQVAVVSTQ